jgi:hypothetical protein
MQELPNIQVGDVYTNLEPRSVRIKNPTGIKNDSNSTHAFNEKAWIREGGELTIVVIDGSQMLVKYQKPHKEKCLGTDAGNGALFLVNRWKFMRMTIPALKKTADAHERNYILELLAKVAAK